MGRLHLEDGLREGKEVHVEIFTADATTALAGITYDCNGRVVAISSKEILNLTDVTIGAGAGAAAMEVKIGSGAGAMMSVATIPAAGGSVRIKFPRPRPLRSGMGLFVQSDQATALKVVAGGFITSNGNSKTLAAIPPDPPVVLTPPASNITSVQSYPGGVIVNFDGIITNNFGSDDGSFSVAPAAITGIIQETETSLLYFTDIQVNSGDPWVLNFSPSYVNQTINPSSGTLI